MADYLDIAQRAYEEFLETVLRDTLKRPNIPYSGFCLNCNDSVDKKRFCCPECRIEYEAKSKYKI